MPEYLRTEWWIFIWPIVVLILLIPIILSSIIFSFVERENILNILLASVAFGALGSVLGFVTGLSREPAVDAVAPAILSLAGAVGVFLLGKGAETQRSVAAALTTLAICFLVSITWGATERDLVERRQADVANRLASMQYLQLQARIEARVKNYREGLGLNTPPSATPEPRIRYSPISPE